jgi:GNAT superfamily N-acetyltransferase
MPQVEWRGRFQNDELNALHAECFEHDVVDHDWWRRVNAHSLGWVTARLAGRLVGFVNVAWDGCTHAFMLDTLVTASSRRRRLATRLVQAAAQQAKSAGCEWLHVDFEPHLRGFYVGACGFSTTDAGLLHLQ